MINYQTITIDLQPDYREPVVQMYLSERDVGRPIQVNVLMQGQPYSFTAGTTVHIDLRKPSGHVVQVNGNYAVGSNVVLFNVVEQMAAEPGMCLTELSIIGDGQDPIGSKNWLTKVELSPLHAGDPSETWIEDLDELVQDAMEGHIDATLSIEGDAADAKAAGDAIAAAVEQIPAVDATLTVPGAAADAKKTGDELADLKSAIEQIEPGLSDDAKAALLACFRGVAWVSQDSQTLYDNLENALNTAAKVLSISAVFEQGSAVIYPEDTLDSLRSLLTVTATLDNDQTLPVLNYDLYGQLTVGTSVITVIYKSKTTTFNVVVSEHEWGSDYTWLYRPSENGLLSEDENVSEMVAINGTFCTETLSGDVLNITAPYTGNASSGNIYKLIPLVCTNAVLKAKVKFNSLAESAFASGFRMQLSNGAKGAQIFAFKHTAGDYRISSHNEGDQVKLTEIQLNRWYIISCEIKPNNTQTLKIDNATYDINALASYANTESRVIVQQPGGATDAGNVNVDIAWITFKNNA